MTAHGLATDGLWSAPRRRLTIGLVLTITLVGFEALAVSTIMPIVARELHKKRDYHNGRLRAHCAEHGVPLADICSRLHDEHLGDELHPNAAGARIIADEVFTVLLKVHGGAHQANG